MGQRLESSAERRLRTFRHGLTLDLFTRHGPFWERVQSIREEWSLCPETRIPPSPQPLRIHLPAAARRQRAYRGFANHGPTQRNGLGSLLGAAHHAEGPLEADEHFIRWSVLVEALHDEFVPAENRVEGPTYESTDFWDGFLSACLLYDPPPDDLLSFADHPEAGYGDYLYVLNPWGDDDTDGPQMLAPPIRFLYETDDLLAYLERDRATLLSALHQKLEPDGIDLWEMVYHFEYWGSLDEGERAQAPPKDDLPQRKPFVAVEPHTTDEEARVAVRMLAAAHPKRPAAIRPPRDPLTTVQCAVWYDRCGWSHERIAEHFAWTVQTPAGDKPRSETARKYIKEGRSILDHRKVAA